MRNGHYQTKPEDRISPFDRSMYTLAAIPQAQGYQLFDQIPTVVLVMCLGVSPAWLGVAMFVFRMWDAVTDPLMGWYSDNFRSKWGRRRPFIVLGAILCALSFPLIYLVGREWSDVVIMAWFTVLTVLFYTCYTVFSVPYLCLAMEMSPDYHERTRIISYRQFMNLLVAIAVGWLFRTITMDCFEDQLNGIRWISAVVALLFFVFGAVPGIFMKERYFKQAKKQEKINLIASMKYTLTAPPFVMVLVMTLLIIVVVSMLNSLALYLNVYYVHGGDMKTGSIIAGWCGTVGMITSMLSVPLCNWLSKRYGKIKALYIILYMLLLALLSSWVLITPNHPWLLLVGAALGGPGLCGPWILLPSMQSDVCDWDELRTGCRREGSFSSMMAWILKCGQSVSMMLAGLALAVIGFNVDLGGAQSESTYLWMRIIYVGVPSIAVLLILGMLRKYPLTEKRCHEIREELESRRGTV